MPSEALLGLVPVARPADVPAAVGWFGTVNSWSDVVGVSAVLRSWEDRFGAVLVRMGRATLDLSVAAPPWERSECEAIAAEHFAFCDDTYAGTPGPRPGPPGGGPAIQLRPPARRAPPSRTRPPTGSSPAPSRSSGCP